MSENHLKRNATNRRLKLGITHIVATVHNPARTERVYARADGSELRLGVAALESIGIEVEPRHRNLQKLPATRLRTLSAGSPPLAG